MQQIYNPVQTHFQPAIQPDFQHVNQPSLNQTGDEPGFNIVKQEKYNVGANTNTRPNHSTQTQQAQNISRGMNTNAVQDSHTQTPQVHRSMNGTNTSIPFDSATQTFDVLHNMREVNSNFPFNASTQTQQAQNNTRGINTIIPANNSTQTAQNLKYNQGNNTNSITQTQGCQCEDHELDQPSIQYHSEVARQLEQSQPSTNNHQVTYTELQAIENMQSSY